MAAPGRNEAADSAANHIAWRDEVDIGDWQIDCS